ncbi:MAG: hypothetical protein LBJ77_02275 [Holosporales bacterium]|jgi:hypothetical protein|nr:hypothetical protein [Holosporales bacterium]
MPSIAKLALVFGLLMSWGCNPIASAASAGSPGPIPLDQAVATESPGTLQLDHTVAPESQTNRLEIQALYQRLEELTRVIEALTTHIAVLTRIRLSSYNAVHCGLLERFRGIVHRLSQAVGGLHTLTSSDGKSYGVVSLSTLQAENKDADQKAKRDFEKMTPQLLQFVHRSQAHPEVGPEESPSPK